MASYVCKVCSWYKPHTKGKKEGPFKDKDGNTYYIEPATCNNCGHVEKHKLYTDLLKGIFS